MKKVPSFSFCASRKNSFPPPKTLQKGKKRDTLRGVKNGYAGAGCDNASRMRVVEAPTPTGIMRTRCALFAQTSLLLEEKVARHATDEV